MVLVNTWARSRAEAVERDLLVVYAVIDIRVGSYNKSIQFFLGNSQKYEWQNKISSTVPGNEICDTANCSVVSQTLQ